MKKGNHIFIFILVILLLSCHKDENPTEGNLDIDSEYCNQITDTAGFNLYFHPFTEYEWKYESHDYKVERRQLPENVLKSLTLEKLFNHCMWLDMAPDILLFRSYQAGFRGAYLNRFNCIQELYERKNVHCFLEEKLRTMDVKNTVGADCWFYKHLLEFIYIQKECLSLYHEDDLLHVLGFMFEKADRLSYLTTLESPHYKLVDLSQWMIGIGNIMVIYEYAPFLEELDTDSELKDFMDGRINANSNVVIDVSKFGTDFYNTIKN